MSASRGYVVTCEDGQVRHDAPFESRSEASRWAEWGHCCTADHSIEDLISVRRRRLGELTGLWLATVEADGVDLAERYVLAEVSKYDGSLFLTSHASPEDAASYHDHQEEPGEWPVYRLADLDSGEVLQASTVATYSTTFLADHGPGCDGPYNCTCGEAS